MYEGQGAFGVFGAQPVPRAFHLSGSESCLTGLDRFWDVTPGLEFHLALSAPSGVSVGLFLFGLLFPNRGHAALVSGE
ncbi:hypothetical protein [Palleronia caenipelagi]|uniref:Uncharacterized protein n=1 Tax=Palleronia caenipelagi TaxID=2489174 RepID=A0A547PMV0_9RHOB|nr:hypothetical protein [Palleronia caenipelagi]TRD15466.1 hypothetical protein FEV53_16245 [Palleronia caenipelagi]